MFFSLWRIGEGRACWSLGNAHTALGNHDQAMHFAEKHLEICKEVHKMNENKMPCNAMSFNKHISFNLFVDWLIGFVQTGDRSGELTARMNVSDLQMVLGLSYSTNNSTLSENKETDYNQHGKWHSYCLQLKLQHMSFLMF